MATRGERRRKLRLASESKGTTSALSSSTPRLLREAYSVRKPNDPTVSSYCADPFSEVDPSIRFAT
ncbi:MAG: hypothetical protein WDO74_22335 [Pseudomonadota bacterium]